MLTVDALRAWGANVDEGLQRCLGNETFYLNLVQRTMQDPSFGKLSEAVSAGDLDRAFDAAHALKGVTANLALTPLCEPVQEITELLRSKTPADYAPLLGEIEARRERLMAL